MTKHSPRTSAKFALVGSSGGHLIQLLATRPLFESSDRFWVCFDKQDARSLLDGEVAYWGHFPTNRHVGNLLRNTIDAVRILRRERPDVVMSTGAALAIPYFALGRLFGCVCVYIEVYDRIDSPTVTGRICHRLAHIFGLQWEEQARFYKRGRVIGPLL